MRLLRAFLPLLAIAGAASCRDALGPSGGRVPAGPRIEATFDCRVDVASGTMSCDEPRGGALPAGTSAALLGLNQVKMRSINLVSDTTYEYFAFDALAKNLLNVPIGTPDGETATGLKVFFEKLPTVTAYKEAGDTGTVTVANPDGHERFSAADQPYFEYDEMLLPGDSTEWRTWEYHMPRTVKSFSFSVRVSALTVAEGTGPKVVVTADRSVTGSPSTGLTFHRRGDTVHYAFAAKPGYGNAQVLLDGIARPAAGSFVVDSTHELIASADTAIALPSTAQALYGRLVALGTAADKPAAYQAYLDEYDNLAAEVGAAEAERQAGIAGFLAADPVAGFAQAQAIDAALANRVFHLGGSSGGGAQASRARRSASASGDAPRDTTVIFFVNGIYTSGPGAPGVVPGRTGVEDGRNRLGAIVREASFHKPVHAEVRFFYNRTFKQQYSQEQQRALWCVRDVAASAPFTGPVQQVQRFALCRGMQAGMRLRGEDIVEAGRQFVEILGMADLAPEADALILADTLQRVLEQKKKIIMIPHSQGNMMTQQAVTLIKQRDASWESTRPLCIGAVSMAAPISGSWPLRSQDVQGVVATGDIILRLGQNHFWRTYTARADSAQAAKAHIPDWLPDGKLARAISDLKWGVHIHYVSSYTTAPQTRTAIRGSLESVFYSLTERCGPSLTIEPDPVLVEVGSAKRLKLTERIPNTAPREVADSAGWSTLAPQFVGIGQGTVHGLETGAGRAAASWNGMADTVDVTVRMGWNGSWTGTWNNNYQYDKPYVSGPMSLGVSGLAGTLAWTYYEGIGGAFPASEPNVRIATSEMRSVGGPDETMAVEVAAFEPDKYYPQRIVFLLKMNTQGSQVTGKWYRCLGDTRSGCGYRESGGDITLTRNP